MTRHESPDAARQRFFEAALKVCAEKGYHATRMDDIAAAAGRSKGAVYHHFSSKKELFVEMCHDFVDSFRADVHAGMDTPATVRELLGEIVDATEPVLTAPGTMAVFLEVMPLAVRDPELRTPLARYYGQAMGAMAELLAWGQGRGELRSDFDPQRIARVLVMGGDGLVLLSTALGTAEQGLADLRSMYNVLLDGLRA